MKTHKILFLTLVLALNFNAFAARTKTFTLQSPDKQVGLSIEVGEKIAWSATHNAAVMVAPSEIALIMGSGEILGVKSQVSKAVNQSVDTKINALFYKKKEVLNQYNQLTISFKINWALVFRAYNDGVAYRFVTSRKEEQTVVSEKATFNFNDDYSCFVPYVCDLRDTKDQYCSAFESLYDNIRISQMKPDSLSLSPLLVDLKNDKKVALLEAMILPENRT